MVGWLVVCCFTLCQPLLLFSVQVLRSYDVYTEMIVKKIQIKQSEKIRETIKKKYSRRTKDNLKLRTQQNINSWK